MSKIMEAVKRSVVARGQGGGGGKQAEHRGLQGSERPLPRPPTLNIRHRLFVQGKHDGKREPDMTHGLWVITMCHCRAIDCHTVSLEYVMAAAAETGMWEWNTGFRCTFHAVFQKLFSNTGLLIFIK